VSDFTPHDWRWSLIMADATMAAKLGLPISTLTSTQRHVGLVIAQHLPEAFPGFDLLARETGFSRSTVIKTVGELEAFERLGIKRGGGRRSNSYYPLMPDEGSTWWTGAAVGDDASSPGGRPQPSTSQTRRRNRSRDRSDQLSVDDVALRAVVDVNRFELLVRPLGRFSREQEHEALRAFEAAPDGFAACCEMARGGRRPVALLLSLIRKDEHHVQPGPVDSVHAARVASLENLAAAGGSLENAIDLVDNWTGLTRDERHDYVGLAVAVLETRDAELLPQEATG
jgi:hypothetical protein